MPVMSRPSKVIVPDVGGTSHVSILKNVVLPAPFGPMMPRSSPRFTVNHGELRGIIGPNGAGKTTFFKMLTCEVPPTSGTIVFEGRDITGMRITDVCQLGLTKSYQVNQLFNRLTVRENITIAALAELRGIIGPNGAGKSTFFKMLTCEVTPTFGQIRFEGRDITGMGVTEVCQLGLTKSYQVTQLFDQLTVGENVTIAALAERRGPFRLDLLSLPQRIPGLQAQVTHTLELIDLTHRAGTRVSQLAYGEKRRLEVGLALASSPNLLLLDEPLAGMSPAERVETVKLLRSIGQGRTMIIIDHDMDSLFELVERVTVLQEGRVLVEGTPDEIKANAAVQEAYLGGMHTAEVA